MSATEDLPTGMWALLAEPSEVSVEALVGHQRWERL